MDEEVQLDLVGKCSVYNCFHLKALTRSRTILKSPARNRSCWRVPSVDQVMADERAAAFGRRSIKTSAKLEGLKLVVSMTDLTTLEGSDTPGKIATFQRCQVHHRNHKL